MNAVTEKEVKSYYKQIEKSIPASPKEKNKMMQGLQTGIEEYIEQNPDATLEDIHTHFGEPAEIAAEYLPDVTPKDVKRFTRRKKIILGLSVGLAAIIILFAVVYFWLITETEGVIKETGKFQESSNEAIIVQTF